MGVVKDAEKRGTKLGERRAEGKEGTRFGRRDFLKLGAGAAGAGAGIGGLDALARAQANSVPASPAAQANSVPASPAAQQAADATHGTPWWAARPANGKA